MSPPVLREILGMSVNTLTAAAKYFLEDCEIQHLPIEMQLSKKKKHFHNSLFYFWNLHNLLNILKQRMIVIGNVFQKLVNVQYFLRSLSK